MGIYLNPGNEVFAEIRNSSIFVDKSMMIKEINRFMDDGNKYVCLSRPRRFGKTVAGNMLTAYYSKGCDSRSLFQRLRISQEEGFSDKLNRYNVIKIDMNNEYQNSRSKDKVIFRLEEKIKKELGKAFPEVEIDTEDSLAESLLNVYGETGETFIVIMDEYDILVREQVSQTLFDEYLSFLNGLFKSDTLRPAVSLAYLTGILPVVRDKIQSKLNNFREYTMLQAGCLSEFVGFTEEDAEKLCKEHGSDFEECRRWYDGYHLKGYDIYNPESVVLSIMNGTYGSYWGKTSSYEVISDRIRQNFEGTKDGVIRMLAGESLDVNVTGYLNTMNSFTDRDDLFTYLIHLGYLAYDQEDHTGFGTCRIPNKEVRQEWINALKKVPEEYAVTSQIIQSSKELLHETWNRNTKAVEAALDRTHIHVTSNRSYNNEDALQSAIYLAYLYALNRYTVIKEMTTGKGFADVVFIPFYKGDPAMIIELKRNDSSESALEQIKNRQYYDSLAHYQGNLLFVGINYDVKDKTHSCQIETCIV